MLNQKGWKTKEPVEYGGREVTIRFKQLLHYAVSEEIITLSRGAELVNIRLSDFKENVGQLYEIGCRYLADGLVEF